MLCGAIEAMPLTPVDVGMLFMSCMLYGGGGRASDLTGEAFVPTRLPRGENIVLGGGKFKVEPHDWGVFPEPLPITGVRPVPLGPVQEPLGVKGGRPCVAAPCAVEAAEEMGLRLSPEILEGGVSRLLMLPCWLCMGSALLNFCWIGLMGRSMRPGTGTLETWFLRALKLVGGLMASMTEGIPG